ncbi:MAG TPA: hypothetical protein VFJ85_09290 [Acidimicrobiales bacterium]|nr:hypothetical protein [Acidimicrobiales bacterium]
MVTCEANPTDIVAMGGRIANAAGPLGGQGDAVAHATPEAPPATARALEHFAKAYGQTVHNLAVDVIALGRLTQVAGTNYERVEQAAARSWEKG